jgi:uncharacterized protein YuzE
LYIDLNSRPSADSREIQEGVVIDLDDKGKIVGIDIQNASEVLDLATFDASSVAWAPGDLDAIGASSEGERGRPILHEPYITLPLSPFSFSASKCVTRASTIGCSLPSITSCNWCMVSPMR